MATFLHPKKWIKRLPVEALLWSCALIALALNDTAASHYTVCPVSQAGFTFCPGCGLGRSVTHLFHGDISSSLQTHPLGVFAVIVLSFRIVRLTKHYFQFDYGKSY
jgi:hypothetical protein